MHARNKGGSVGNFEYCEEKRKGNIQINNAEIGKGPLNR